jgi:hypothetical protein
MYITIRRGLRGRELRKRPIRKQRTSFGGGKWMGKDCGLNMYMYLY